MQVWVVIFLLFEFVTGYDPSCITLKKDHWYCLDLFVTCGREFSKVSKIDASFRAGDILDVSCITSFLPHLKVSTT